MQRFTRNQPAHQEESDVSLNMVKKPVLIGFFILLLCTLILSVACSPVPADNTSDANVSVIEPDGKSTIIVSYTDSQGNSHDIVTSLDDLYAETVTEDEQIALGYLYQRVYDDEVNDIIATDRYLYLNDVIESAANIDGFTINDLWYQGCSLEFAVISGMIDDGFTEATYEWYAGFTYEKLTAQEATRYFYTDASRIGSLFGERKEFAPTVIALSTVTEELGIPEDQTAGEYLDTLLSDPDELGLDLRSSETAPRLLWGLSANADSDIAENRFPANITRIRIVGPNELP
jgi:hypothetical protein